MSSKRIVVLTVCVAALLFVAAYVLNRVRRAEERLTKPEESVIDTTTLVTRVRELARLETEGMHVVNISTISQGYAYVPDSLGGDRLTLWAEGDVIAGVDLSKLQDRDVHRDPDGGVTIVLPPAEILVTRVDNKATHVVNRDTGILRRSDPGLEGRARLYAERAIHDEALRRGILPRASASAETKIGNFVRQLGFAKVRFVRNGTRFPGVG